ncbi:carotenoid oxygenase family protein [Sphingomonas cannabina]|uniref:8'-apo-carotenoid 13,14-cleaving dioxygenase n=1 Tax=Sphingomonas cannabina TaxID=2899123 RepID=UPI001F3C5E30|nr:carotenoid oxygenase family protein [Sphingomonas cannabina]UIJ47118.1 carotenoid oxygenase family protein [Sphingomonas cannabina]
MASSVETLIRGAITKGMEAVAEFNRKRLPEADKPHPFLTGIHAPMSEEKTIRELPVTGTIPAALDGRYLRIGPNPVDPDPKGYHWFVGDGMVHGIRVEGGKALWYKNRWIRSHRVGEKRGVDPAPGPRHGNFDTVNTNVVGIAGRTYALVEAGSYPVELADDLEEQTYNPFDDTLVGSFSAHPHRDPATGEWHAIAYEATRPDEVRHVVLDAEGQVIRELPIAVKHGPSIHDCAITEHYVLVLDLPVTFSMKALIGGHGFPYRWNPEHQARIGLLPRAGTAEDIVWIDLDPLYIFHVANAYEDDGKVVLDAVTYATMFDDDPKGPNAVPLGLERLTLDPVTRSATRRMIDPTPQEFPRPDERRFGRRYRYAYTLGVPQSSEGFIGDTRLYKHDLDAGTRQTHDFGEGRYPGEFVFVPASAEAAEDEGWLIGLVVDLPNETTDLVILDAQDFEKEPQASIRVPHRVPPGFHGNWVAS